MKCCTEQSQHKSLFRIRIQVALQPLSEVLVRWSFGRSALSQFIIFYTNRHTEQLVVSAALRIVGHNNHKAMLVCIEAKAVECSMTSWYHWPAVLRHAYAVFTLWATELRATGYFQWNQLNGDNVANQKLILYGCGGCMLCTCSISKILSPLKLLNHVNTNAF